MISYCKGLFLAALVATAGPAAADSVFAPLQLNSSNQVYLRSGNGQVLVGTLTGSVLQVQSTQLPGFTGDVQSAAGSNVLSIKSGAVVNADIATSTITGDKLAAATVTYDKMAAGSALANLTASGVTPLNKTGDTATGNLKVAGAYVVDTTYSGGSLGTPANGAFFGAGGNTISYVPLIQGVGVGVGNAPTNDHQRATGLFTSVTLDDSHSQENTVGVETAINAGYAGPWSAGGSFAANSNIYGAAGTYRQVSGNTCTSGSTAPSGTGDVNQRQTDGSCVWLWVNAPNVAAKVGIYSEVTVSAGAGNSWNMALNTLLKPGTTLSFHDGVEFDFGNNAGECYGGSNCNNVDIETGGNYRSTHVLLMATNNPGPTFAAHFGLRLAGSYLASDIDIDNDSDAAVGFGNCGTGFVPCNHTTAGYLDQSTSPIALQFHQPSASSTQPGQATGTMHSVATIVDDTTTPTSINIAGNKGFASIYEHSTTPIGLRFAGTYSQFQVQGIGWNVSATGVITAQGLTAVAYVSAPSFTENLGAPSSSAAFCNPGQFADDASYHYLCISQSHWVRSPAAYVAF